MIDPAEIDWLAAQYALGSLPPGERRLVRARIGQDRFLAEAIAAWEHRLSPLSLKEPGLAPPPRVLEGVLASIAQRRVSDQHLATVSLPRPAERASSGHSRRAAFAALAAALSVVAIGAALVDQHWRAQVPITGTLEPVQLSVAADEPARPLSATFAVVLDPRSSLLTVRRSTGAPARASRVHLLWLSSGSDDDVVLLGRLEPDGPTILRVDDRSARRLEHGRLWVTLEAEAWTVKPRGPTIASGRLSRTR